MMTSDQVRELLEEAGVDIAQFHGRTGCHGPDCHAMCRLAAIVREQQAEIERLREAMPEMIGAYCDLFCRGTGHTQRCDEFRALEAP